MTAVVEPAPGGLRTALRDAAPLLLGVALLMAGNGLTSTLLGIRAGLEGFRPGVVGVVLAGYYLGFVLGSVAAPSTISRVGHVRVFAGLASLASGSVLIHVIQTEPLTWFLLRFVSGMCISALYVVCETWLNGASTNRTRGSLLAVYMVVVSGALLSGQLLFSLADPAGFASFVLASVLLSLAVVPVSLASFAAPVIPDPVPISLRDLVAVAPLAAVGATLSGFVGAAMISAGVVYAAEAGFSRYETGAFIGAALAGGVVLQVPLGQWSDRVDRRFVIAVAAFAAAAVAVVAGLVGSEDRSTVIALATVAGGTTFPLYSLSNAHLNDYLDPSLIVAGGARMVLVNGMGSVAGPIVGGTAVGRIGPDSLFTVMAVGYVIMGSHAVYRMTRRVAPPEEERATFTPYAVGVGPTAVPLAEAEIADLYPPVEGVVDLDGDRFAYQEQGAGDPVVLVDDPSVAAGWDDVLSALAADGLRAISPDLAPAGDADPDQPIEELLGVLRHLEISSATFVGAGAGADLVARLADAHPDRVDAVVLMCEPGDEVRPAVDEEAAKPTLLLDLARRTGNPEELADDITQFLRHL